MGENKTNFKLNIILQISYQLLSVVVPLISTPYISRIFSATLIGEYTFSISIANYFILFAMLGINVYASREIPKCKDNRELLNQKFSSLFYNKFFFSFLSIVIYAVMISFYKPVDFSLLLIAGVSIFSCFIDLYWFFLGLEKVKLTVTRNMIIKIASLLLIFIFVKNENDLWKYALIVVGATLFSNLYLWLYLFKYVRFVKVSFKYIINDAKYLFILFIPAISTSLFRTMDKIILGSIGSKEELGLYEQADKIINMASLILSAIGTVSVPRFTALHKEGNKARIDALFEKYNLLLAIVSCSIAFGIAAISKSLANVYLGSKYTSCDILIFLLSICVILTAIATSFRSAYLLPLGMDKFYTLSTIGAAIINIVADFSLIPFLGARGAVIGTILAEFVLMLVQSIAVRKQANTLLKILDYVVYSIPGALMMIVVLICQHFMSYSVINLLLLILIGAAFYISLSIPTSFIYKKRVLLSFLKKA